MSYRRLLENANYLLALVELLHHTSPRGYGMNAHEARRLEEISDELTEAAEALDARKYLPQGWGCVG